MSASAAKMLRWLPAWRCRSDLFRAVGHQTRIALLVSFCLLGLMALSVVLGVSALGDSTARALQERVVVARTMAHHLDSAIARAARLLEPPASELARPLQARDLHGARAVLSETGRRLAGATTGLLLYDSKGSLLLSEPSSTGTLVRGLSPETLDASRAGASLGVGWVRDSGGAMAVVVVPVVGVGGERVGYLGAVIDLAEQVGSGLLPWTAAGNTARVDLIDGRGALLLTTAGEGTTEPGLHSACFLGLLAEKQATVITSFECLETSSGSSIRQEVVAFAPLQSASGGVVVRQSRDEVLEPIRLLRQQMLALGALSILVALVIVWLATRSQVGRIHALTISARSIADGKLTEAVAVQGDDEIGQLGHTLEHMRARLRRYLDEVRRCNMELDLRVQERTDELERSKEELESSRDQLQTLINRLSALNAMAVALNQSLDLETILKGALLNALKLTGMGSGAVYLVDRHTGELELAVHHGLSLEAAQVAANLGLSASLCASVAQSGQPLVVEDISKYARGMRSVLRDEKIRCMVRVPFVSSGTLLGTMCLGSQDSRSFSQEEVDLLVSVSNQIAVAVQNARLYRELQRKERKRGELLQKVISAQEDERKRIARELHDQTSQALATLAVVVETAAAQAEAGEQVGASLARMRPLVADTLEEVHRLIFDLRPTLLDDLGLIAALRWYAETRLAELGIKVRLEIAGQERRLAAQIETALYRVVQEAVNNVTNHSGAQNVTITLILKPDCLSLTMVDDGWGFDMAELARSGDGKRGLGLMGMKERVELLGGTFAIYSELGGGTKITLEVPLEGGEAVAG